MSCNAKQGLGNTLYVLLGFGGTGGKTIAQLAEIATHDPVAAELIRSRVHVVLCDTDVGDLCSNHNDILREFDSRVPGGAPPVETFALGAGSDVFQDLVQQRFQSAKASGTNGSGLRAFRDHWWHDSQGQPFSAYRMPMAINAGAAQCPMVSHFLAWDGLDRFERVLQDITDRAMNERGMENFTVELFLVSSLAGGTGRGCWQLLSLKAREFFGARKQACRPTGFFVDASAFEDLMKNRPDQRIKLQVNALTGLSELSMWLKDPQGPERKFILPDLSEPADDQVASINTEKFMPEAEVARKGRNPVHRAYVFTSRSDSVFLDSDKGVYKACAASIYSKLSMKQARSADAISPARAVATATSILFVPVSDIQQVFRIAAKGARAKRFLEGNVQMGEAGSKTYETMADVTRLASGPPQIKLTPGTSVEHSVNQLCAAFELFFQFPENCSQLQADGNSSEIRDRKTILHSLVGHFQSKREALLLDASEKIKEIVETGSSESFGSWLQSQCQDDGGIRDRFWLDALKSLEDDGEPDDSEQLKVNSKASSNSCQQRFFDKFFSILVYKGLPRNDSGNQRCASLAALAGSGKETGSPAVLDLVVDRLIDRANQGLLKTKNARTAFSSELNNREGSPSDSIFKDFESRRRIISKVPFLKSFFNPLSRSDSAHIHDEIFDKHIQAVYPSVLDHYESMLGSIKEQLGRVKSRSGAMVDCVLRVTEKQGKAAERTRKSCFTLVGGREDSARELKALKDESSIPVARIVRKLRPVFRSGAFDLAVHQAIESDNNGEVASEECLWLGKLTEKPGSSGWELNGIHLFGKVLSGNIEISRFQGQVVSGLESILDGQTVSYDHLEEEFSITKVMGGFLSHWAGEYDGTGNLNTKTEISKAVEDIVGVSLSGLQKANEDAAYEDGITAGKGIPLPSSGDVVASTAIRMALKCDPLIQFGQSSGHRGDTVTVFLPKLSADEKLNKDQIAQVANRIRLESRHMKDCINHISVDTKGENPYMMVVSTDTPKGDFESRGWDGWESFNYWRTDADIKRWLLMAEDTSGKSVFCHDDDSIGLGYLSPQYVRNPYFANRRWRPWVDGRLTDRKWKALAYALIGNDLYRNPKVPAQITEKPFWQSYQNFKKVVSNLSFNRNHPDEKISLPLLLEVAGGDGPSFQRRLLAKDSSGELRLVGLDVGPSSGSSHQFRSIRSFIEWFYANGSSEKDGRQQTSDEVFDRVWEECLNLGELLRQPERLPDPDVREQVHAIRSPETRDAVNEFIREYVREWLEYTEKNVSREDDRQQQVKFLKEFQSVLEKGDVLGMFDLDPAGGK